MDDREMKVRIMPADDAPGVATTRQWPLSTLVAYLFDGRGCEEVRELLALGDGTAHGTVVSWTPITLTAQEISAIESRFPKPHLAPALAYERATFVELDMPALQPTLSVPIRGDQPLVEGIAQRAAYLAFDYGPWADVYVSTLTREEAAELLADPARRVHDAGEAELA
ncbi:MAG: hypothetical protein JJD97_13140, partial [Gemmatimonadaceae bacterium]|nr:hypothetical protein [Gemmatimonadaceae bacterium]